MSKKIAVIGSGISGLGISYILHNNNIDFTLFEKQARIGGHSNTINAYYEEQQIAVDTGFIVFNKKNYPYLTSLFDHLNVDYVESNMSFSLSKINGSNPEKRDFEYSGESLSSVFAQRRNILNPSFIKMLFDVVKFNKNAPEILNEDNHVTIEEYLEDLEVGDYFKKYYLMPMAAAIWSCPLETIKEYPAKTFIRFFDNHGLLTISNQPQWYTVKGGSVEYVKLLTSQFKDRIKTSHELDSVIRKDDKVIVSFTNGKVEEFDEVIMACHGDETYHAIEDKSTEEEEILSLFNYEENLAVLHYDSNLMPKSEKSWASWNYLLKEGSDKVSLTYWMNKLQPIDEKYPLFVTMNPTMDIDENKVIKKIEYTHPIFNHNSIAAQKRIKSINGSNKIWYCGAYLRYGFHEDGLLSAVKVAEKMQLEKLW
jgi:predicted NAD/FAD-binding protein